MHIVEVRGCVEDAMLSHPRFRRWVREMFGVRLEVEEDIRDRRYIFVLQLTHESFLSEPLYAQVSVLYEALHMSLYPRDELVGVAEELATVMDRLIEVYAVVDAPGRGVPTIGPLATYSMNPTASARVSSTSVGWVGGSVGTAEPPATPVALPPPLSGMRRVRRDTLNAVSARAVTKKPIAINFRKRT